MSFAPEILADVPFGLSENISIQVYTQSNGSSIRLKFAILKTGLKSGTLAANAVVVVAASAASFYSRRYYHILSSLVHSCLCFFCLLPYYGINFDHHLRHCRQYPPPLLLLFLSLFLLLLLLQLVLKQGTTFITDDCTVTVNALFMLLVAELLLIFDVNDILAGPL